MTLITSSEGTTMDIDLDLNYVMTYEEEHPEWSIFDVLKNMKSLRFVDLDIIAKCCGFQGYKDFTDQGFGMEDLTKAVLESKYLGFSDGTTEQD